MKLQHLDHLNLSVKSFEESVSWYQRVLGFNLVEKGLYQAKPWGVLRSGEAMLCIYEDPTREYWSGEVLGSNKIHGINHFGLRITDRKAWEDILTKEKIQVEYGGAYRYPFSTSWYIQDPTGYSIEIVLWDENRVAFKPMFS